MTNSLPTQKNRDEHPAAQGRLFWWFWWCGVTFKRDGRGVAVGLAWPPVRRFVDCQLSRAEREAMSRV